MAPRQGRGQQAGASPPLRGNQLSLAHPLTLGGARKVVVGAEGWLGELAQRGQRATLKYALAVRLHATAQQLVRVLEHEREARGEGGAQWNT